MERGEREGIAGGCLCAGDKEDFDASNMPVETRFMQSRVAFLVRCINRGLFIYQQGHQRDVAPSRGRNQRGRTLGISRFDVCSSVKQQLDPIWRPFGERSMNRPFRQSGRYGRLGGLFVRSSFAGEQ